MPYIKIDGLKIFYILHLCDSKNKIGTVILVHGAGGNHLSMSNVFNHIKKNHRNNFNIFTFDLPFHFRSTGPSIAIRDYEGIEYYSFILNQIILNLFKNERSLFFVGHSMGGQICLKLASLYPKKIKKVMLSASCHKTHVLDSFLSSLEKSFDRTIALFLLDAYGTRDKEAIKNALKDIKRTANRVVTDDFRYIRAFSKNPDKCGHENMINSIKKNKIFLDIVYSKTDLIIPKECIIELHGLIENSKLTEINSENHMNIIMKNSQFLEEIDKFLLT